jgi:hypothetical protein
MAYSTLGFIETLKPQKRSMWRTEFVEPYSLEVYGYIIKFWPVTILRVTGWHGETISVVKMFNKEIVW